MKSCFSLFAFLLFSIASTSAQRVPLSTTELGLTPNGPSRMVVYSNRCGSVYATETTGEHRSTAEGWSVLGRRILEDYTIRVGDHDLLRSDVVRTEVKPNELVRHYRNGVVETVTLFDNANAIAVLLDSIRGQTIAVRPFFRDIRDSNEIVTMVKFGELIIGRAGNPEPVPGDPTPGWLGIVMTPASSYSFIFRETARSALGYSPASLVSAKVSDQYAILFVATPNLRSIYNLGASNIKTFLDSSYDRRVRMDQVMKKAYFRTGDELLDRAFHWAHLGVDGLFLNVPFTAMRSGLPFDGTCGAREAFRAMTGAFTGTGQYGEAKELFRAYALLQDTAAASLSYGMIPDDVAGVSLEYRNADVTPLFVAALERFVNQSGDTAFAREMFPAVVRAVEGTLAHHVDRDGFLVHDSLATWMPAARGNRAVEVEALWHRQLAGASVLARLLGHAADADRWAQADASLRSSFVGKFYDSSRSFVYDFLTPSGREGEQVRPNQLLALDMVPEHQRAGVLAEITRSLVYPYGVGTLSSLDASFIPYRNERTAGKETRSGSVDGIVSPWLTGSWITLAARHGFEDSAFTVTKSLSRLILEGRTPGALPQYLDAVSSAQSQGPVSGGFALYAPALGEFLRSWYEGYLGVWVDDLGRRLTLSPRLPASLTHVDFNVHAGPTVVMVQYDFSASGNIVTVATDSTGRALQLTLQLPPVPGDSGSDSLYVLTTSVQPGQKQTFHLAKGGFASANGAKPQSGLHSRIASGESVQRAHFVRVPSLNSASIGSRVGTWVLRHEDIQRMMTKASAVLEADDPAGDDTTAGALYPPGPGYPPGSCDITHFGVREDSASLRFTIRFRNLPYPVLHPSAGFDGVITAVAIDRSGKSTTGPTRFGHGAGYEVPHFGADLLVYVGDGIRVEGPDGRLLGEYHPSECDEESPIGNFSRSEIEFSLPRSLVGQISQKARFAVIAGPRDDSQGAVGMFVAGDPSRSAVFDTFISPGKR